MPLLNAHDSYDVHMTHTDRARTCTNRPPPPGRVLRDATDDIKREIQKSAEKQGLDTDITKDIRNELNEVKKNVDEVTGAIKRK